MTYHIVNDLIRDELKKISPAAFEDVTLDIVENGAGLIGNSDALKRACRIILSTDELATKFYNNMGFITRIGELGDIFSFNEQIMMLMTARDVEIAEALIRTLDKWVGPLGIEMPETVSIPLIEEDLIDSKFPGTQFPQPAWTPWNTVKKNPIYTYKNSSDTGEYYTTTDNSGSDIVDSPF